jgi:hypothetical protein
MRPLSPTVDRLEEEHAELEAVLASDLFGRTSYLVRFLTFVCERYFAGEGDTIKEYSIAVEALGRPPDFDPQSDTIVRVTAHALRRRLEDFYRTTGADHAVQICLPAGHYVPRFIYRNNGDANRGTDEASVTAQNGLEGPSANSRIEVLRASAGQPVEEPLGPSEAAEGPVSTNRRPIVIIAVLIFAALCVAAVPIWRRWHRAEVQDYVPRGAQVLGGAALDRGIRVLVGENRPAYTDRAGLSWQTDRFCSGGSSFSVRDRTIRGTDDPLLFLAGRNGAFRCRIPVAAGTYELHLLFAETAGLQENARSVVFAINDGPPVSLDVVDDAAGDDVATVKVFAGIRPQIDGTIHLDFTSSQSFLNAIEVLPVAGDSPLPLRIVTGHSVYRDGRGNVWLPDRYAFGGRLSRASGDLSKITEGGLYEWQRIGHFRYVMPVVPARPYTLKLYFREPWFGMHNGNPGGVGSRIFDVACNGSMLLKNFDILGEAGAEPIVRTFSHIQPTAQGKIEISFTPVVNYPSVNAIEVIPE